MTPTSLHLEDNEIAVLLDECRAGLTELKRLPTPLLDQLVANYRIHPHRWEVLAESRRSALVDRLLEFKPEGVPVLYSFRIR